MVFYKILSTIGKTCLTLMTCISNISNKQRKILTLSCNLNVQLKLLSRLHPTVYQLQWSVFCCPSVTSPWPPPISVVECYALAPFFVASKFLSSHSLFLSVPLCADDMAITAVMIFSHFSGPLIHYWHSRVSYSLDVWQQDLKLLDCANDQMKNATLKSLNTCSKF